MLISNIYTILIIIVSFISGVLVDRMLLLMPKSIKTKPRNKDLDPDFLLSEIVEKIISMGIKYNGIVDPKSEKTVKIKNLAVFLYDILDKSLSEEELEIINRMDQEQLDTFIYNIIDSNYDKIFEKINKQVNVENILFGEELRYFEENNDTEEKRRRNKPTNTSQTDISGNLIDFYNEGQDI